MNLNVQPTSHFKTILSGNTLTSKKSLSSIVKDLKQTPGMSTSQKRLVKKTVYNLNTNPNAVVTNRQSKAVVGAMRDRGHLKERYHKNLGAAIHQVQRAHMEQTPVGKTKGKYPEGEEKPEKKLSKREKIKQEKRQQARMNALARERRAEDEMKKRGAKYSVGRNVQVSAKSSGGMSEEVKKSEKERFEKNQAIDMMID